MKHLRSNKGVAAIEFALLLPLLLAITFGLIEFGFLMYNQQIITNAAREGARRGIVQGSPRIAASEIEQTVHNYADAHLVTFGAAQTPAVGVSATCPNSPSFGNDLIVTVTYAYTFLVAHNFIPGLGSQLTLNSQSVMKCE